MDNGWHVLLPPSDPTTLLPICLARLYAPDCSIKQCHCFRLLCHITYPKNKTNPRDLCHLYLPDVSKTLDIVDSVFCSRGWVKMQRVFFQLVPLYCFLFLILNHSESRWDQTVQIKQTNKQQFLNWMCSCIYWFSSNSFIVLPERENVPPWRNSASD